MPGDFTSAYPAVSAAGDRAAIARGNTVMIYQLPGGRLLRRIDHLDAVNAVAFGPFGHDLVSGAVDGSLLVTRDGSQPIALSRSPAGIDAAGFLADGRVVAAAGKRLRIYNVKKSAILADLELPSRVRTLRPSPDGVRLVTVAGYLDKTGPVLWDLQRYQRIVQFEGRVGPVYSARFVDGHHGILTAGFDGSARLWDGVTGRLKQTYRGSTRFLADATLTPDGSMIVAGGADGMLRFWNAADGSELWRLPAHRSAVVGVHFEGRDIVTRGFRGEVSRWTLPNPAPAIEACMSREACAIVGP